LFNKTKKLCTLNGDGGNFYPPPPVSLEGLSHTKSMIPIWPTAHYIHSVEYSSSAEIFCVSDNLWFREAACRGRAPTCCWYGDPEGPGPIKDRMAPQNI